MSKFNNKDLVLSKVVLWGDTFYRIFPVEKVTDTCVIVNTDKYTHDGKAFKGNSSIAPLTVKNYKVYLEEEIRGRVLDLYSIPASSINKSFITIDKSLELSLKASNHILDKFPNTKNKIQFLLSFLESYNKISSLNDEEIVDKNLVIYY